MLGYKNTFYAVNSQESISSLQIVCKDITEFSQSWVDDFLATPKFRRDLTQRDILDFRLRDKEHRSILPYVDVEPVQVPCTRCVGCDLDRSRQWAVRCVNESDLHDQNCFLTLTYDDAHLPEDGSLHKDHLQKFWKRARFAGIKLRYFACGEYGSKFSRPHYHAIVFGYWPEDTMLYSFRQGQELYVSPLIAKLWPFGYHIVADVTFQSAAYVARYCLKKVRGREESENYYGDRQPEFVVMSRKPGIGADWLRKYHDDVYPADDIVISDKIHCKPPKYYDQIYDLDYGDLQMIKTIRRANAKALSIADLKRKEKHKQIIVKQRLKRNYENNI